jgi:hypothetical protein
MTWFVPPRDALPPHARQLVAALAEPGRTTTFDLATWDLVVRSARSAQLLGTLAARVGEARLLPACPAPVRRHLQGAATEARYLRQMAVVETARVGRVLRAAGIPFVLLKGAGYIAADLPVAAGRMLRDVDVLVPRARLADAEATLVAAGWQEDATLDAYDRHYYRAWSHQIPPLRREGSPLELDVHHGLLPATGRLRPDASAVIDAARPVAGGGLVPEPADQVVHAALHLFQDSDCTSRLREIVDIDALCRHAAAGDRHFWTRLVERAVLHQATRPLGYALAFARGWFGTPVEDAVAEMLRRQCAPPRPWVIVRAARSLPPPDPDGGRDAASQQAARWMFARALWLRMPPWLLAYHATMKAVRRIVPSRAGSPATTP